MKKNGQVFVTGSAEETRMVGEKMSGMVVPGEFVLLYGPLGAGKTEFVRGFARGCGWEEVRSPSFTIVNEYYSEPPIIHVDFYRVDRASSEEFALEEYAAEGCIVIVEWADLWESPDDLPAWEVRFSPCEEEQPGQDDRKRFIEIFRCGEGSPSVVQNRSYVPGRRGKRMLK
jgi:tRNA threonylcarbamoyladenosine biosynthesis protein TsaE